MLESIMTGKTAAQLSGLSNSFDLMSRTPENVRIFNAAMVDLTRRRPARKRAICFPSVVAFTQTDRSRHDLAAAAWPRVYRITRDAPSLRR